MRLAGSKPLGEAETAGAIVEGDEVTLGEAETAGAIVEGNEVSGGLLGDPAILQLCPVWGFKN